MSKASDYATKYREAIRICPGNCETEAFTFGVTQDGSLTARVRVGSTYYLSSSEVDKLVLWLIDTFGMPKKT